MRQRNWTHGPAPPNHESKIQDDARKAAHLRQHITLPHIAQKDCISVVKGQARSPNAPPPSCLGAHSILEAARQKEEPEIGQARGV